MTVDELFKRTRHSRVLWNQERDELHAEVSFDDEYHDMGVTLVISRPHLKILSVTPRMDRSPYPICPGTLERSQQCVGMTVSPGLEMRLARTIGGGEGCTHVTGLILDACRAAVQAILAIHSRKEGDARGALPAAEKIAFLEKHGLTIRNSCLAYSQPVDDKPDSD